MSIVTKTARAGDLLQIHGARNQLFGGELFTAGAWDIMLYLYATDTPRSLASICDALDIAEDTGRRWLAALESEGLIMRDEPAVFHLTDRARNGMMALLVPVAHDPMGN